MRLFDILLAEDNPGDVLLVQQALEAHDVRHSLHVVRDGEQALAFIAGLLSGEQVHCPDLILLDLNLPKVDGAQVLAELRNTPECADTPVVVITSSDAPKDHDRVSALGVDHYFKKPSDFDSFLRLGAIVRDVVGI
jgi:CheY-like chemotaxis protein